LKAENDAYSKQKQLYKGNTTKVYALVYEQISKAKSVANKMFKMDINDNPIEVLQKITKNCLNYQEHHYEMSIILDSMKCSIKTI
jgi:hypothetical protein